LRYYLVSVHYRSSIEYSQEAMDDAATAFGRIESFLGRAVDRTGLPPDEAVVMVSSVAPIKAKKLRYYADANFKRRVLPPPVLVDGPYADAPPSRPDEWSGLAIPAVPAAPTTHAAEGVATSADDGGPRRQPELSEVAEFHPDMEPSASDLSLLDDDDLPLPLPRQFDPAMQRTARLASLDPNDGIDL